MSDRRRVVVVTGGGGGIGAAIAESLGRAGAFVVTVDPMVSVDGARRLPDAGQTTADKIIAAGGAARTSDTSVTDAAGIHRLFTGLAEEFGALDAVINVAGISRPTTFTEGSDEDWRSVLTVHLDGYRNVLDAAMPLMVAAGGGHILGVTSGSGWRPANVGAYSCAKRAVASLTWQLGRHAPDGVVVNAISPIAATRMVAAATGGKVPTSSAGTGGLSLGSMPTPEQLGPLGAHLVAEGFHACRGRVLFAGGSEVAVIDEPRLIEVVRSDGVTDQGRLMAVATEVALAPSEIQQASTGGSNARFRSVFDAPPAEQLPPAAARSCALVTDRPDVAAAVGAVLAARGVTCHPVDTPAALADIGALDAVVVAMAGPVAATAATGWQRILAEHDGIVERIHADAQWARSVADLASAGGRTIRLVTVTDATTAGGRSRAQACAQLARAGRSATDGRVQPFAISAESGQVPAELVAHLVCGPDTAELAGAELATGDGWFGLRSHPRPIGSISFGGPAVPTWFDDTLREVVQPR
ncbi:short-chain dehydrogenase/reductase SDR [Mycolicibacterium rhodesiae JS60]|nr:short-chain dehydrogenase/reductase SDR [Mycolicibacterium rhodesiae JS60]